MRRFFPCVLQRDALSESHLANIDAFFIAHSKRPCPREESAGVPKLVAVVQIKEGCQTIGALRIFVHNGVFVVGDQCLMSFDGRPVEDLNFATEDLAAASCMCLSECLAARNRS